MNNAENKQFWKDKKTQWKMPVLKEIFNTLSILILRANTEMLLCKWVVNEGQKVYL